MSGAVLVTGAGGFVGGATAAALRVAGAEVRAGMRRGLPAPGAVLCDLARPETLKDALAGVDLVVHAAYGDVSAMPAEMHALLAAMTTAGVGALIFISSIAVYGAAEGALSEDAAPGPGLDAYGAAKLACEAQARAWAAEAPRRAVTLLRPGIVYGSGSRFWTDKLAERLRAGAWGDFGRWSQGSAALIHIDDLASLIVRLAGQPTPGARALNAVGPDAVSWAAYFEALARRLDAPAPPRWSETAIRLRPALSRPAKLWRRLRLPGLHALALSPTRGELALFARRAAYATDAARALGWEARIGLAEGLRRTKAAG